MSIRPEMHLPEKLCWSVILGVFLVAEIHSIHADRTASSKQYIEDRRVQNEAFGSVLQAEKAAIVTTLKGFNEQQDANRHLLESTKAISTLTEHSLDNITGGDSYAVVMPLLSTGGDTIPLLIENRGDKILNGTTVTLYDQGIWIRGTQDSILKSVNERVTVGTLHPGERLAIDRTLLFPPNFVNTDGNMATKFIYISAQNFTVQEFLWLRKIGKNTSGTSSWEFKMKVYRASSLQKGGSLSAQTLLESTDWAADMNAKITGGSK
jgi:hypothetical protein